MMYLKGCPRCKGDLQSNNDTYGTYQKCIQCGFLKDVSVQSPPLIFLMSDPGKFQSQLQEKLG